MRLQPLCWIVQLVTLIELELRTCASIGILLWQSHCYSLLFLAALPTKEPVSIALTKIKLNCTEMLSTDSDSGHIGHCTDEESSIIKWPVVAPEDSVVTFKHCEWGDQTVVLNAVSTLGDPCVSWRCIDAVICSGAEWPLCMFNECVISCAVITHKCCSTRQTIVWQWSVCVFRFEHPVWVAVGSLCGLNVIHAPRWASNNNFNEKCNYDFAHGKLVLKGHHLNHCISLLFQFQIYVYCLKYQPIDIDII